MLDSSLSIRYQFGTSSNNAEQPARPGAEPKLAAASAFREMLSRTRLSSGGPRAGVDATPAMESRAAGLARLFGERPALAETREVARPAGKSAAAFEPRFLEPDNTRFNPLDYASPETAQYLAERFGGTVGYHQYGWMTGVSMTPGIADVVAPPPFAIIDFGNTQVNAGLIASYYVPGRFSNPDAMAAQALYRAGVRNEFVDRHLPGDLRQVPIDRTTNPVTGQEVKVPA